MFGSKKNKGIEEQYKEVLAQLAEKRERFDAGESFMEDIGKRLATDVEQVMENSTTLTDHAMVNIEEEAKLMFAIDELAGTLRKVHEEQDALRTGIEKQLEGTIGLVEDNKHYTSPARYLSEAPGHLREKDNDTIRKLKAMEEDGHRMGVLSLNAAIEAGRMGDGGKQFVAAAEEIRQTALAFEKKAIAMEEELEQAREQLNELEDVIGRIIAMIKEGNMGTTRLLKGCQEMDRMMKQSSMKDFSEDMIRMRDKIVGLRNLDEEIAKSGERNKLQISDIRDDLSAQKLQLAELESDISYIFDVLESQ